MTNQVKVTPPERVRDTEGIAPRPRAEAAVGGRRCAGVFRTARDATADAVVKIVAIGAMVVIVHGGWLLAGASLSRFLRHPIASRAINRALAAVLVITTWMAFLH